MASSALCRLAEERKQWRKDHPVRPLQPGPGTGSGREWKAKTPTRPPGPPHPAKKSSPRCVPVPQCLPPFIYVQPGMVAKPITQKDGSVNLFEWEAKFPGLKSTICEGGLFPCTIRFHQEHPHKPPRVMMPRGFFHVNVFEDGGVCLSILKEVVPDHLGDVSGWRASFTVKQILVAVQELLSTPNFGSIANMAVYHLHKRNPKEYLQRMKAQTAKYVPSEDEDA